MRKNQYSKKSKKFQDIAKERINILFREAKDMFKKDKKLANKYVALARRIAMKYKVKLPKELKRRFCKHCHSYLIPGTNCRIRTKQGHMVYFCLECKKHMRYPYLREKKA